MRFLLAILLLLFVAPARAQQGQGMSQAVVVSSCGGGALPNGAVNQLTMNPQGQLCLSGIGSSCPQATSYLGRTVGGNEGGNAANIIALICGLVADGVWTQLDALYILAQQNSTDALLNLVGTSYSITGAPLGTFTAYRGVNSGTYSTNFNGATAVSPKFTQNSANVGIWDISVSGALILGNSTDVNMWPNLSGAFYARIFNTTSGSVPTSATSGLFVGDRNNAATSENFLNGADLGPVSSVSGVPANAVITFGQNAADVIGEAHIGGSLGATLNLALYNRLRTYMTAVGVP